jgi:hypothetical protein
MKKVSIVLIALVLWTAKSNAQEKFGNALNLGLGFGYYGVNGPAFHLNYEFDVFRNFTLAPFVTFQTRRESYNRAGFNETYYRQTYIPIGLKGSYYFDELFDAGEKWDFWAAASLGFAIRKTTWENGDGSGTDISDPSPVYGNLHIGTEVHLSEAVGLFLDMSTGISTFGLGIHF